MAEKSSEKLDVNLKEVLYLPSDNEKNTPQLLQSKSDNKDSAFLYLSAFTACMVGFSGGCSLAWSSPAIEKLKDTDPNKNPLGEPITSIQESWIAALLCLGAAIGPLFAGKSADSFGRKTSLMLIAILMIAGYLIESFATNIITHYIARLILGFGLGSVFAVLPTYLGEITEDHNRGKFCCIMPVFVTLGLLYPFAVGPLVSLKVLTFSCAVPLMLFLVFFYLFIPDSPVFLISSNKRNEAKEALMRLRDKTSSAVEKELLKMTDAIEKSKSEKAGLGDLFRTPCLRKGLLISVGLLTLQQFAGINAVLGFLGQIFEASGSGISTYISTNLVSIIQICATILAAATVEKLGRKFLLLAGCIGSSTAILILGLYFYLKNSKIYNVDSLFWLPVASLIVYIVAFNIGLAGLPWTVMGDMFPSNIKTTAASITSFTCFLTSFVVTLAFPIFVENFGMAQCFWLFGICGLVGSILIYVVVPETKGKTLAEIQQILGGN